MIHILFYVILPRQSQGSYAAQDGEGVTRLFGVVHRIVAERRIAELARNAGFPVSLTIKRGELKSRAQAR
ncbi:MAG: hypothetical protein ABSG75_07045 [Syntrophales bacterium]